MTEHIIFFDREYDFLSNFYPATVVVDGIRYLSSEGAYQAAKCADLRDRLRYANLQPNEAKRLSREENTRKDWRQVKIPEMEKIVRAKFTQNPHLARYLLETGDSLLYEGNTWHDLFWGVDRDTMEGENHLGQILMALRASFLEEGLPPMEGQLPWPEERSADGICVQFRDLTQIPCDALVHASGEQLYGNDGLDYAVHRAAGPELRTACAPLVPCAVGEVRVTPGFRLAAKYVLHTVGPRYGTQDDQELLRGTYRNVLDRAAELGLHRIALPAVSVGRHSFPKKAATALAVETVRQWKQEHPEYPVELIFACVDQAVYRNFLEALQG